MLFAPLQSNIEKYQYRLGLFSPLLILGFQDIHLTNFDSLYIRGLAILSFREICNFEASVNKFSIFKNGMREEG